MLTRQLTLKPSGRKPPELGPKVRIEAAHLGQVGDETGLAALVNRAGLRDLNRDGLLEQDTAPKHMWRGACSTNLSLEFELPEPVALGAIKVWNYNADWETTDGLRKADVAVSADGATFVVTLPVRRDLKGAKDAASHQHSDGGR